jgi:threonine/homoserine/homoserine lactone efflux protein
MSWMLSGTLAFLWTCLVIELTPGPNMSTLAVLSAIRGRRAGFAAVAGVALGLAIIGALAALGLAAVIDRSHLLYETLRWAGSAYLLWLAWEGWRDSGQQADREFSIGEPDGISRYFRQGLITNLLNPKAGVFYVTVLPTFVDGSRPPAGQTVTLTAIYVAVATAVHLAIVIGAGRIATLIDDPAISRIVRRTLAIMLALIALWLAWSTRR